jgi:hypothetical protein
VEEVNEMTRRNVGRLRTSPSVEAGVPGGNGKNEYIDNKIALRLFGENRSMIRTNRVVQGRNKSKGQQYL